jgi:chromosome partitioning protein
VNESTFAPGGGQPGLAEHAAGQPGEDAGTRLHAVGSVAVRTFEARQAADRDSDMLEHGLSYAEFPYGSYEDPDAEYEPDPE